MRIRAEINFLQQNTQRGDLLFGVGQTAPQSNVSKPASMSSTQKGYKGFFFAQNQNECPSIADGSYKYFDDNGYPGYVSRALSSDESIEGIPGYPIGVALYFRFTGEAPKYVTIQFDSVTIEYAQYITVSTTLTGSGVQVINNALKCLIDISSLNLGTSGGLYIILHTWSKPYKNAKVTDISFNYDLDLQTNELQSVICSETLFTANFGINAGVIEQYADLSIYDRFDNLHTLAEQGMLTENLKVTLYVINGDDQTNIGTCITTEWGIQRTDDSISLHCTDWSKNFSEIIVPRQIKQGRNLFEVINIITSAVPYTFSYIDTDTEQYVKSIVLPMSYWNIGNNVADLLQAVCDVGLLNIYWYKDAFIIARCY